MYKYFLIFLYSYHDFRLIANGEVIVTLLPTNEKLPWIMPAKFRPELVPEELMAPVLTVSFELISCSIFHYRFIVSKQLAQYCYISYFHAANSWGVCTNYGKVDNRYEIYLIQYMLQKNSHYMDNTGIRYLVEFIIFWVCGKLKYISFLIENFYKVNYNSNHFLFLPFLIHFCFFRAYNCSGVESLG